MTTVKGDKIPFGHGFPSGRFEIFQYKLFGSTNLSVKQLSLQWLFVSSFITCHLITVETDFCAVK